MQNLQRVGANCHPPFDRDYRRYAKDKLCQHRRHISHYPVYSVTKAGPFKRWLAKIGYERVQEIEDPELVTKRTRALYQAKGYSADWIEKRIRGIVIRDGLTNEWKQRGAKEQIEYAILTAEISKATFGMTPSEYKELKQLKREKIKIIVHKKNDSDFD